MLAKTLMDILDQYEGGKSRSHMLLIKHLAIHIHSSASGNEETLVLLVTLISREMFKVPPKLVALTMNGLFAILENLSAKANRVLAAAVERLAFQLILMDL